MYSKAISIWNEDTIVKGSGRTPSFFSQVHPVVVGAETITELLAYAEENDTDVRLCLHGNAASRHHDMIIAQLRTSYFLPHRHLTKGETWSVLRGVMAAFVFDENGRLIDARKLSVDGNLIYRVGDYQYHMLLSLTPFAVYHESKPGPFLGPSDSEFAPWVPLAGDSPAVSAYIANLLTFLDD